MPDNRPQRANEKYAATRVAVLIPVKRGLFRRNGLLAVDQAGTLSLPSAMQDNGSFWQETGTQIMVRFGLDRPASAMKLTTVLSDVDGGNLLVCETDPISAAEGRRLTATETQVLAKPAVMSTVPATEIVKAFFTRPRYNTGNNSMLLPGIIALTSSGTFDASASCSSSAANSSSSSSSCN